MDKDTVVKIRAIKNRIEFVWCLMSGFALVVFAQMLENGASDDSFKWGSDVFNVYRWNEFSDPNIQTFIFGVLFAAILIWSIKTYRGANTHH